MRRMIWKVLGVIGLVCLILLTWIAADGMARNYGKDNSNLKTISPSGQVAYAPVNYSAYWQGCVNIAALWAGGILLGLVLKPCKPRALQPPPA